MSLTKKLVLAFFCVATIAMGVVIWVLQGILRESGQQQIGGWLQMLAVLTAVLACTAGLGFCLEYRFAKRLLRLTESATTIASGHFDAMVTVTTKRGEIRTLACAFNRMAARLQSEIAERSRCQELLMRTKDESERGVDVRTAQLLTEI